MKSSPITSYFIDKGSIGNIRVRMDCLVKEGCRRDIAIDRRIEIRAELTKNRRELRTERSL